MWGPSGNQVHVATSQHQPFPHGSVGRRWGPAEDRGGHAGTAMGSRLLLVTPAASLEQPETQPCLCQEGHMLWDGDGGSSLVEGRPIGGCSRPSKELHHSLAANPRPSPSGQPCSPQPETPLSVKAAAPASGLQDGVEGGLAGHVGDGPGRSRDTSANQGSGPSLQDGGGGGLAEKLGRCVGTVAGDFPQPQFSVGGMWECVCLVAGWLNCPPLAQLESGGVGLHACGALDNQCTTG